MFQGRHSRKLDLDDKEVFTGHPVALWINGALQHLELALRRDDDPVALRVRPVPELRLVHQDVFYVHEV